MNETWKRQQGGRGNQTQTGRGKQVQTGQQKVDAKMKDLEARQREKNRGESKQGNVEELRKRHSPKLR